MIDLCKQMLNLFSKQRLSIHRLAERCFLFLLAAIAMHAGNDVVRIDLNDALGMPGIAGTEFYMTFPPYKELYGMNNRLFVVSIKSGYVTAEVAGKGYSTTRKLLPNAVTVIDLAQGVGQVYSGSTTQAEKVFNGSAVHITATVPVIVYATSEFSSQSESFVVVPTSALGKEYIVSSMALSARPDPAVPSELAVIAPYEGTMVEFTLGGNNQTETVGGLHKGDTETFSMNSGDVWVVGSAVSSNTDMSGSVIRSNKPIAVISAHQCAHVPINCGSCNLIMEMELPTSTWGKDVQVPQYGTILKSYQIKVFAKDPNTAINYDGQPWKILSSIDDGEGKGWIYQLADSASNKVISLDADKPINVTAFRTVDSFDRDFSETYQTNVVPVCQYQRCFIFSTLGSKTRSMFRNNFLGVVFPLDTITRQMPDDLEFGVSTNGEIVWKPLASVFGTKIRDNDIYQIMHNRRRYALKECYFSEDNVYAVRAKDPIMCYLHGGYTGSYGHPLGGSLYEQSADTTLPAPTFSVNEDGSVIDGYVVDYPSDTSVRSNLRSVILNPRTSFNYTLDCDRFIPGHDSSASFRLKVIDARTDARAEVIFTDRAGNSALAVAKYAGKASYFDSEDTFVEKSTIQSISPNPISSGNSIVSTKLSKEGIVRIDVINSLGQVVCVVVNEHRELGIYDDLLLMNSIAEGLYIVRMQCNGEVSVRLLQVSS